MTGTQSRQLATRTTREVVEDHLRLAAVPDGFEADLARNVVVLPGRGVFRGIPGVRELARQLMSEIPSAGGPTSEGRMGVLKWTVDEGPFRIRDGADA